MRTSNTGIQLIKHFESLHDGDLTLIGLQPKMCPAGYWTEGYGHAILHNGKMIKGEKNKELAYSLSTVTNEAEAEALLKTDVEKVEKIANRLLKKELKQHEFDALISHTFNCGVSETLYKLINDTPINIENLQVWWRTKYISSAGKTLKGLIKRRKCEYNLFSTGILNFNL